MVRLDCDGRGPWANQTVHLISPNPLEYHPAEAKVEGADYEPITISRRDSGEEEVLTILAQSPVTATDLCITSHFAQGTIRNAITRLKRKGLIMRKGSHHKATYHLTPEGRKLVGEHEGKFGGKSEIQVQNEEEASENFEESENSEDE